MADILHHYMRHVPQALMEPVRMAMERLVPVSFDKVGLDFKLRAFLRGQSLDAARAHYSWRVIFTEREKREILLPDFHPGLGEAEPSWHFTKYYRELDGAHFLDMGMYTDIKTWLVDDILVKIDRATMAHSLEARAPLLDYRIVEFAASLPVHLKLNWFRKKYIFKRSQQSHLPASILSQKKRGFNAPVSHWLNSSVEQFSGCLKRSSLMRALFSERAIRVLWEEHRNRTRDNGLKLFSLISLALWGENNGGISIP